MSLRPPRAVAVVGIGVMLLSALGGGVARAAIVAEGGRGVAVRHPAAWFAPGAHVCLTASAKGTQLPVRGCRLKKRDRVGAGVFRIGSRGHYTAGALIDRRVIPVTRGLRLTFSEAQWGGSGGDGILVFLQNGNLPITPGTAFSGSRASYLGYTPRAQSATGLPNAIAGIALDNYGDFSSSISNGHGCSTGGYSRPRRVAVRGPGNGTTGYCLVAVGARPVATMHATTRRASTHRVSITISPRPSAHPRLVVAVDGRTRINVKLARLIPRGYHGATLGSIRGYRFGFASNTGRVTDNHEIWNIRATFAPTLAVATRTTPATFRHRGQLIRYRFTVTNTGGDLASNILIRHGAFRLRNLRCSGTRIAVARHVVCTGTHRVTAAEAKAHLVRESVWATGIRKTAHRHDASPRNRHLVRFR